MPLSVIPPMPPAASSSASAAPASQYVASASALLTPQLESFADDAPACISNLVILTLSDCGASEAGLIALFNNLNAPELHRFLLSAPHLGDACAPAVAAFLESPRARALRVLDIAGSSLTPAGAKLIIDAAERSSNCSIAGAWIVQDEHAPQDPRQKAIQARNATRFRSLTEGALTSVVPLRLLLHARAPPPAGGKASDPPLLRLPLEIRLRIARLAGDCPGGFSDAQFARIVSFAQDRTTLRAAAPPADEHALPVALSRRLAALGCNYWDLPG